MADGVLGAVGTGAAQGASMGSKIGSMIPLPGAGAAGAAVGALAGGITSGVKQKRANEAEEIAAVDPMERTRLSRLSQISKNLSSGTDTLTQQNIGQQKNIGKAAQTALTRSTGGDVGQTMNALLQSQKATQGGVNQAVAQAANRIPYFDSAQGALTQRIAQRRLELGLLDRSQRLAENAQARTDANVNTQALLATEGGTSTVAENVGEGVGVLGNVLSGFQNRMAAKRAGDTLGTAATSSVPTQPEVSAGLTSQIPTAGMSPGEIATVPSQTLNQGIPTMSPLQQKVFLDGIR